MRRLLLAAGMALLAPLALAPTALVPAALAQTPPAPGAGPDSGPPPVQPAGPGRMADMPPLPPGGPRGRGGPGGPPPPLRGAHFRLDRGDARIDVKCADDDTTRECADVVNRLLDRLASMPAGPARN